MNELLKDLSKHAVSLSTISPKVKLTKGQTVLLTYLRKGVENGTPISWDHIVDIYYNCVSKTQLKWYDKTRVDILQQYVEQTSTWQYTIKPKIRTWFVCNIGILVIKNQLFIIPTIEMND